MMLEGDENAAGGSHTPRGLSNRARAPRGLTALVCVGGGGALTAWLAAGIAQPAWAAGTAAATLAITVASAHADVARRRRTAGLWNMRAERIKELERARAMLVTADEQLRREIAAELHGRVQTRLVAAELMLEQAKAAIGSDPDMARDLIARVLDVVGGVRDRDVRGLSHRLHPATIQVVLLPALRNLLSGFEEAFGVRTSLTFNERVADMDNPDDRHLHDSVALIVYRAVEEALVNSQRHGRATSIAVNLSVDDDGVLHLVVDDNGCGVAAGKLRRGLGLTVLEGRVEPRGGHCALENRPAGGARLTVSVPMRRADVDEFLPPRPPRANATALRRRAEDCIGPTAPARGSGSFGRRRGQRPAVLAR